MTKVNIIHTFQRPENKGSKDPNAWTHCFVSDIVTERTKKDEPRAYLAVWISPKRFFLGSYREKQYKTENGFSYSTGKVNFGDLERLVEFLREIKNRSIDTHLPTL